MDSSDRKVGEILKTLSMLYGLLSEIGALVIAITIAEETYSEGQTFFAIFFPCTLIIALTTALLYAVGVIVDNIVMIREKVVGTDKELGRNKLNHSSYKPTTINNENKIHDVGEQASKVANEVKSQADKTLEILKNITNR